MDRTMTVLLVEDEPLATILYEELLKETEFRLECTFTCNGDTLRWLSDKRPDLAIVDVFLDDGPCEPIMDRMDELKIPYIIVTGRGEGVSARLPQWRQVNKPFRGRHLRNALRRLAQVSEQPE
jgi:DNA-binding response OmpR family regulator